jgi:putative protease
MNKPELLLPAGNIETFYAALEGGANAVYLGLKHFNARERALNFTNFQIPVLIKIAHKKNCKVYITLNTVIKNNELNELIDVLDYLRTVKPDGVIIQDWGVFNLIKKYFPELPVHASTQMANHNSLGAIFSYKHKFERIILARELSLKEIETIIKKTKIETEVFIHGALCYSFSGMCNFSSYLGGHGANRGLCSQVCRRAFNTGNDTQYFFSLKDNQQIENIENLIRIGVRSLKVEGRLKSSDYVYKVAQAYRKLIDDKNNLQTAQELLKTETGRAKTPYFLGNNLKDAITYDSPNTGIFLGKIRAVSKNYFEFETDFILEHSFKLRVKLPDKDEQINLKVQKFQQNGTLVRIFTDTKFIINSRVYLSSQNEKNFSSKLPEGNKFKFGVSFEKKKQIINSFSQKGTPQSNLLYLRIDSVEWIKNIKINSIDYLILSFDEKNLNHFNPVSDFIQTNKQKIWIEFPHFISESKIEFYKKTSLKLSDAGLNKFFLSHISQKLLLPKYSVFAGNENMYVYNDAAADFFFTQGAESFCYPTEIDSDNLELFQNKNGIIPVYFYPRLFISRMPVKIKQEEAFFDSENKRYKKIVKGGISYTFPDTPVSFLQYVNKLKQTGFAKFLIDLSFEKPSKNRFNTLIKKYKESQQVQPSTNFNYKRTLK